MRLMLTRFGRIFGGSVLSWTWLVWFMRHSCNRGTSLFRERCFLERNVCVCLWHDDRNSDTPTDHSLISEDESRKTSINQSS